MDRTQAAQLLGWSFIPDGWSVSPINRAGELAGFVLVGGNEIHAYRLPAYKGRWLTRQTIEQTMHPLLEKYGCVVTKVLSNNPTGKTFVSRLGFVKTHEENGITHYRAERFNHARL